jgi:hypothetical protein
LRCFRYFGSASWSDRRSWGKPDGPAGFVLYLPLPKFVCNTKPAVWWRKIAIQLWRPAPQPRRLFLFDGNASGSSLGTLGTSSAWIAIFRMHGLSHRRLLLPAIEAGVIALLFAAAILLYRPGLYAAGSRMDEAVALVYPEMMLQGKMAYRDFETFYSPGNICTLAIVFRVFGTTVMAERIIGLFYRFALFAALYTIVRWWGRTPAIGAVVVAIVVLIPLWFANAWIMALALSVGSLGLLARFVISRSNGQSTPAVAGIMAGMAIFFRTDIAPAVLVSGLALLIFVKAKEWRGYLIGTVIGCAPFLFWIVGAGWRPVIENLFLYPAIYSHVGRGLPLFGQGAVIPLYLLVIVGAAVLVLTCSVVAVFKKCDDPRNTVLVGLACLAVLALPQLFQRADSVHATMVAPITVALLPLLPATVLNLANKPRFSPLFASLMTLICLIVLFTVPLQPAGNFDKILHARVAISHLPEYVASANGRKFPLSSPKDAQAVTRVCGALLEWSRPGQRLFVGPLDLRRTNYNDAYFYYLLPQLIPASYFIEMNPMSANRVNSRLASDVDTADWVILDSKLSVFHESNDSEKLGPEAPMIAIQDHFIQVAQIDQFSIFRRRRGL